MSCHLTEKISLLVDGELSEGEAREVRRHLFQCADCQLAQMDFLSFRSQIVSYRPQLDESSERAALNRILNRQPADLLVPRQPRWAWSFNTRLAAVAALIVLAAIIGLVTYRAINRRPDSTMQAQVQQQSKTAVENTPRTGQQRDSGTSGPASTPEPSTTPAPSHSPVPSSSPKQPSQKRFSVLPDTPNFASNRRRSIDANTTQPVRSGDAQTLTALHLEKSELLLRALRNVRPDDSGASVEIEYERKQARQLVLQNMMLRREADSGGDVQVASLLENLEPILLDIANLPSNPDKDDIQVINDRVERKNIVALLQVNSTVLARALD